MCSVISTCASVCRYSCRSICRRRRRCVVCSSCSSICSSTCYFLSDSASIERCCSVSICGSYVRRIRCSRIKCCCSVSISRRTSSGIKRCGS